VSIDLAGGKVRGFIFNNRSGAPARGTIAQLLAELDNGLWRTFGVLAADHAGYVSYSLEAVRTGGRRQVRNLQIRAGKTIFDIPPHVALTAPAPAFVLEVEPAPDVIASALPAIQDPDDVDRQISPGSFATPPTLLIGGEDCGQLIPGGLAGFNYGVYRVLRVMSENRIGYDEVISRIAAFASSGSNIGEIDVHRPLNDLPGEAQRAQLGLVLRFEQSWQPVGQCLGDIVYSLALAPGEARDMAMIDWSRSESVSRLDSIDYSEQLLHNQHHDRSIEEAINAGLHEHQEGWSFLAGTAGAASASIPIDAVRLSASADHAIGVGISSSTGDRNLAGFSQQELADTVTQSTTLLRGLRSTVLVQADQNESNTLQTRTVANHNRCHALTIQYYEVLRTYRIVTKLAGVDLALLVPHALVSFDAEAALRWRVPLQRNLLDPALADCFAALAHLQRCRETAYNGQPAPVSPPTPPPALTYAATSYTVRLDTGPRETWGPVWVYLVANDGHRSCIFFKESAGDIFATDEFVLPLNSTRTWVISDNDGPIDGVGLDLRSVESIEVEWVEANGNDAWMLAGVSVTATADGTVLPILINGKRYYGVRPYIQEFKDSGHVHQVWAAPAKIELEAAATPTAEPASENNTQPQRIKRDRDTDECCAAMLLGHLNDNAAYYSRVVWVGMDPAERRMRLFSALGADIANAIDDRPLAVGGNQVAFQLNAVDITDPRLTNLIGTPESDVRYATVPARGLFAEAELGSCNACERRDITRITDWSPVRPPQIGDVTPGPRGTTPQLQPAALPGPVVQVVQAPTAPDPTGLGAAYTLLGQSNVFRDMTGRAELEHLLSGLVSGAVSLNEAQILAQQVKDKLAIAQSGDGTRRPVAGGASGSLARTSAAERDAGRQVDRLDVIEQARNSGLIGDEDARGATLGVVGGEPWSSDGQSSLNVQQTSSGIGDAVYWSELLTFLPPEPLRAALTNRGVTIVPLSSGWGDVNLDYYPVRISKLPLLNGQQASAQEFLEYVRTHFNKFVDISNSEFVPFEPAVDTGKWESADPVGAVIDIKINTGNLLGLPPLGVFIDESLVVCTRRGDRDWILSTARGGWSALGHPVSGNRMWAIDPKGNEWILYTMGADRATTFADWSANAADLVWRGADALWRSFQNGIVKYTEAQGGAAQIGVAHSRRYDWNRVRQLFANYGQQI
jgi:hypothetical protein